MSWRIGPDGSAIRDGGGGGGRIGPDGSAIRGGGGGGGPTPPRGPQRTNGNGCAKFFGWIVGLGVLIGIIGQCNSNRSETSTVPPSYLASTTAVEPVPETKAEDPKPEPPKKSTTVSVPDVTDITLSTAKSSIEAAGLTVVVEEERVFSSTREGYVTSQSPTAGTSVERGSTVRITISKGEEPKDDGLTEYAFQVQSFWQEDKAAAEEAEASLKVEPTSSLTDEEKFNRMSEALTVLQDRMRPKLDALKDLSPPDELLEWHNRMCEDYEQELLSCLRAADAANARSEEEVTESLKQGSSINDGWKSYCRTELSARGYDADEFETYFNLKKK